MGRVATTTAPFSPPSATRRVLRIAALLGLGVRPAAGWLVNISRCAFDGGRVAGVGKICQAGVVAARVSVYQAMRMPRIPAECAVVDGALVSDVVPLVGYEAILGLEVPIFGQIGAGVAQPVSCLAEGGATANNSTRRRRLLGAEDCEIVDDAGGYVGGITISESLASQSTFHLTCAYTNILLKQRDVTMAQYKLAHTTTQQQGFAADLAATQLVQADTIVALTASINSAITATRRELGAARAALTQLNTDQLRLASFYEGELERISWRIAWEAMQQTHAFLFQRQQVLMALEMTGDARRVKQLRGLGALALVDPTCNADLVVPPSRLDRQWRLVFQTLADVRQVLDDAGDPIFYAHNTEYLVRYRPVGAICLAQFTASWSDVGYELQEHADPMQYVLLDETMRCYEWEYALQQYNHDGDSDGPKYWHNTDDDASFIGSDGYMLPEQYQNRQFPTTRAEAVLAARRWRQQFANNTDGTARSALEDLQKPQNSPLVPLAVNPSLIGYSISWPARYDTLNTSTNGTHWFLNVLDGLNDTIPVQTLPVDDVLSDPLVAFRADVALTLEPPTLNNATRALLESGSRLQFVCYDPPVDLMAVRHADGWLYDFWDAAPGVAAEDWDTLDNRTQPTLIDHSLAIHAHLIGANTHGGWQAQAGGKRSFWLMASDNSSATTNASQPLAGPEYGAVVVFEGPRETQAVEVPGLSSAVFMDAEQARWTRPNEAVIIHQLESLRLELNGSNYTVSSALEDLAADVRANQDVSNAEVGQRLADVSARNNATRASLAASAAYLAAAIERDAIIGRQLGYAKEAIDEMGRRIRRPGSSTARDCCPTSLGCNLLAAYGAMSGYYLVIGISLIGVRALVGVCAKTGKSSESFTKAMCYLACLIIAGIPFGVFIYVLVVWFLAQPPLLKAGWDGLRNIFKGGPDPDYCYIKADHEFQGLLPLLLPK